MHPTLGPRSVALYGLAVLATLVVAVTAVAAVEWVFSSLAAEPFQAASAIGTGICLTGAIIVAYVWSRTRDQ